MCSALAQLCVILVVTAYAVAPRRRAPQEPPPFSVRYLPSWISGLVAIVKLGADEDSFLRTLQRDYGTVVYLPWPLKQYFVLEAEGIEQVYRAPSKVLSFLPIRREMQRTVFDAGPYASDKNVMDDFYRVHARGMQKSQLDSSLERFVEVARRECEAFVTRLDQTPHGVLEVGLDKFLTDIFFEASLVGLFGPSVREPSGVSKTALREAFDAFDDAFPLLASGLVPPLLIDLVLRKGRLGQRQLATVLQAWVEAGFPGLEKGVVRDMAQTGLDRELGVVEVGKLLVADAWALQANAPYVTSKLLLYMLQAPGSLFEDVRAEIDDALAHSGDRSAFAKDLPLLQSCITETLRLGTSIFSIRDVEQPLQLRSRRGSEIVVPANSRVICATRASHFDPVSWGPTADEWDGRRFFDGKDADRTDMHEPDLKSKRSRRVWGFGGGISRCEGNILATNELKAFVSMILSTFELELVRPTADEAASYESIRLDASSEGIMPRRKPGRVGLGVLQFENDVTVRIRRRTPV